ncbi:DUF1508 domain-containing protein [Nocardia carnea]|uniref:DUF1508 domain-containing protein n=1 Tax=Nocardia carnea TaxID=37328 RepID=UPI002453C8FF|nr:DUF1508 domain-containing protein [Nocardia carnea]
MNDNQNARVDESAADRAFGERRFPESAGTAGNGMSGPDDIEIYRDGEGRYRWRRVAPNGGIVADGGQGYRTYWGAKKVARSMNGKLPVHDMRWVA